MTKEQKHKIAQAIVMEDRLTEMIEYCGQFWGDDKMIVAKENLSLARMYIEMWREDQDKE